MPTPSEIRKQPEVRKAIAIFTAKCRKEKPPCYLCSQAIDYDIEFDPSNSAYFEVDHLYPISTHPQDAADLKNLRPSHKGCNRERGNGVPLVLDNCSKNWEAMG